MNERTNEKRSPGTGEIDSSPVKKTFSSHGKGLGFSAQCLAEASNHLQFQFLRICCLLLAAMGIAGTCCTDIYKGGFLDTVMGSSHSFSPR